MSVLLAGLAPRTDMREYGINREPELTALVAVVQLRRGSPKRCPSFQKPAGRRS